jgi:hypothetical protein
VTKANDDSLRLIDDPQIKLRLQEGNWSSTGWDQDQETTVAWLEVLSDSNSGTLRYPTVDAAIEELKGDLIRTLEGGPTMYWDDDIEFLVTEMARLVSMRNNLINVTPSQEEPDA